MRSNCIASNLLPSSSSAVERSLVRKMSAANNSAELQYLLSTGNCTLALCPLEYAFVTYDPNLAGNVFYAAIFGLLLLAQTALGIRYKTWSFMFGMCAGLVLEVVGYAGRVLMHYDPFSNNNFLL